MFSFYHHRRTIKKDESRAGSLFDESVGNHMLANQLGADVDRFSHWLKTAKSIVFFGGAGVSTESGLPDFRGAKGIYQENLQAESILTPRFLTRHPDVFWAFYRQYFMVEGILPNAAHLFLAHLEAVGVLKGIVTQNVDGLHQMAGSRRVIELHGSGRHFYCMSCGQPAPFEAIAVAENIPKCSCGGFLRPDIVLYEEPLKEDRIQAAIALITDADLLIVGGTSLRVYPAAGLIQYRNNARLVVINRDPTAIDDRADLCLQTSIAALFGNLHQQWQIKAGRV